MQEEHMPWFLAPSHACWDCRTYSKQKVQPGSDYQRVSHPACTDPMINDNRLRIWALLCNGLLWFLVRLYDLTGIADLLPLVQEKMPFFTYTDCQTKLETISVSLGILV